MARPRTPRSATPLIVVAVLALSGVAGSVAWGVRLGDQADAEWRERGRSEAVEFSASIDGALLQVEAQIRALSTLFVSSQEVSAEELASAEANLPQESLSVTLIGLAFADIVDGTARAEFEDRTGVRLTLPWAPGHIAGLSATHAAVTLSSRRSPMFHVGADLVAREPLRSMAMTAIRLPGSVVMSPAFEFQGHWFSTFAITAPNRGKDGLLVGVLRLSDLFDRTIRWVPAGLELRLYQDAGSWAANEQSIIVRGRLNTPGDAAATHAVRFTHGEARWRLWWDLRPFYRDGPDTTKAWLTGIGGSTLSVLISLAIGLLLYQNALIRRRVVQRTAELFGALQLAEQGSHAKTNFLAVVGHELRTPLNAIIGFAEVIEIAQKGKPAGEHVRYVLQGGRHLLRLVDTLLELARAESGALELNEAPIDLLPMIQQKVRSLLPVTAESAVRLSVDVPANLPHVMGDEDRLRLIVVSLAMNGLRAAAEQGEVTVGARLREEDGGISLFVTDTGPGMTETQVSASLRLFEQVEGPMNRRYEGLGIGLPLCRHLASLHGGDLRIDTAPGRGTTVTVDLPADRTIHHDAGTADVRLRAP